MRLKTTQFPAYSRFRGEHIGVTYSFDCRRERDSFAAKLQKKSGFLCSKSRDISGIRNEFWVTGYFDKDYKSEKNLNFPI